MTKFSAAQQSQLAQIGAFLRENREKQSKSLEDIAIGTYIRPQLLSGIEMGDPDTLPEPIFVQGFIRRYAEALGLKGVELAQQFTVNSIPSTPRPLKNTESESSSTTRLTRPANAPKSPPTSASPKVQGAPMFSAGSAAPLEESLVSNTPQAPPAGERQLVVDDAVANLDPANLDTANLDTANTGELPNTLSGLNTPDADIPVVPGFNSTPDLSPPDLSTLEPSTPDLSAPDLSPPDRSDSLANKVSDFDQKNLVNASVERPEIKTPQITAPPSDLSQPEMPQITTPQFDDDLPTAFTTEQTPAELTRPVGYANARPVGVDLGDSASPNLKPFAIGAIVVAALTAGVVLLANLLGGGDPAPSGVADAPDATEQPADVETLPPVPEEPEVVEAPAVSDAPVYVEATATSEAWVSINADGNPVPIFEGTLQPGDTQVWEAEDTLVVYSGDAGALELAQNGNSAEVMGQGGQPDEKIFTLE